MQSVLDQAATLLGQKDVATAKEIAEWIGITGAPSLGLFALLKRIYGKGDTPPAVTFTTGDQTGTTIINIAGDAHGLLVSTEAAKLLVSRMSGRTCAASSSHSHAMATRI